jgi:hypothetical protein
MIPALILVVCLPCATLPQEMPGDRSDPIESLEAELERLKGIVPDQAVAMTQVAYNFGNLWFAAHAENWALAQFYFSETRTRMRWAMRIAPVRRLSTGEIELEPLLAMLEANQLPALERALSQRDVERFERAYQDVMDACEGCHAASDKAYLRLRVPDRPPEPLIDFRPQ